MLQPQIDHNKDFISQEGVYSNIAQSCFSRDTLANYAIETLRLHTDHNKDFIYLSKELIFYVMFSVCVHYLVFQTTT